MKLDETLWPVVVFTLGATETDDDWRRMFAHYDAFYARRQFFHAVTDATATRTFPSAAQRRLIAELSRDREDQSRRWCLGGATVMSGTVARGVLTAITWISPPVYKLTYHTTFDDALREAVRTLAANGVKVPHHVLQSRSLASDAGG